MAGGRGPLDLEHRKRRSVISGSARIAGPRRHGPCRSVSRTAKRPARYELSTTIRDLVPGSLARRSQELAVLSALDLPVSADVTAQVSKEGDLQSAKIALGLRAGRFGLTWHAQRSCRDRRRPLAARLQPPAADHSAAAVHAEMRRQPHHPRRSGQRRDRRIRPCLNGDSTSALGTAYWRPRTAKTSRLQGS